VDGNRVVVDANHPLAGLPLVFELEIVSVEDIEASER
jgi:FKBP-type peptidyl-prolyl cis-trans isomerase 2